MPTPAKGLVIDDLADKLGRATIAILVQTQGLNVKDTNELRKKMRAAKIDLQVSKNTLLRIASERNNMTLDKGLFEGQTTVAFGYEDEVAAAKAVADYVNTSKVVTIKSAIIGGRALDANGVDSLAKIKGGKNQIKAEVVGTTHGPLNNFYSLITAPMRDLCYVLQARADQLGGGEEAPAQA